MESVLRRQTSCQVEIDFSCTLISQQIGRLELRVGWFRTVSPIQLSSLLNQLISFVKGGGWKTNAQGVDTWIRVNDPSAGSPTER
jgi:hypothetical protein